MPLTATLSSSLGFNEPADRLTTLAVFYDELWIPYTQLSEEAPPWWLQSHPEPELLLDAYSNWLAQYRPLFESATFRQLSRPTDEEYAALDAARASGDEQQEAAVGRLFNRPWPLPEHSRLRGSADTIIVIGLETVKHIWRVGKPSPDLFGIERQANNTPELAAILAGSIFGAVVPRLQALSGEQILEVREALADTREEFSHYLAQHVDDLEGRMQTGEKSELLAARETVERKILPMYATFRRQLLARKTGFWANLLAHGSRFFQINASPATPLFWGQVLDILASGFSASAGSALDRLSLEQHALGYVASLQDQVEGLPVSN